VFSWERQGALKDVSEPIAVHSGAEAETLIIGITLNFAFSKIKK